MAVVSKSQLQRAGEVLKRIGSGFTPGQKAVTAVAVLGLLVGALVFMHFESQPSYAVLFSNLQPTTAGTITSKLTAANVPYKLADNGSTILVPQNEVYQERIDLAKAGVLTNTTVGLSAVSKEGITTSQFAQQVTYQRALQGQLERTIDAMRGVSGSQVNLAMEPQTAFALNAPKPSGASVLVDLQPGVTLSQTEVQAIVHLVASSIPGLSSKEVTVADSDGVLLAGPGVSNTPQEMSNATAAYDAAKVAKLQAFLDTVLGPGNADVQVDAHLNFDKVSTTTKTPVVNKAGKPVSAPTSTTSTTEKFSGPAGTGVGGVIGTITTPPGTTTSGPVKYSKSSSTTKNIVGESTTTETQALGTVKRQSVAVLVNSKALPKGMSVATLQSEVAAAAGIDPARGDVLSFSAVPFSSELAKQAKKAAAAAAASRKRAQLLGAIRDGVVVLLILAVVFLLWRSARRARRVRPALALPAHAPYALEPAMVAPPVQEEPPALVPAVEHPVSADIAHFIDSQPDEVATLLRSWIEERRPERRQAAS
jgi:flagellar M-ring protein FliF